jgi:Phytanoyl-CoA dioxygenase (PhyH)
MTEMMLVPTEALDNEVPADGAGDQAAFAREGYAIGRNVFDAEMLRTIRAPLVEALVADGRVEPVEGEQDRFRWTPLPGFNRLNYEQYFQQGVEDLLLKTGVAARAIDHIWGRRATIWDQIQLFVATPGRPAGQHRDLIPFASTTESDGQIRLWTALTEMGDDDGALALARGSHLVDSRPPAGPAKPRVLHPDVLTNVRGMPPVEQIAPLWGTTRMDLGDAIVFRSDVVHGSAPNNSDCLRMAFVLTAQDASIRAGRRAGLSLDCTRELTDIEWVILAILAVQPTSSWDARCACYPRGVVGRLWEEQPVELVERAFVTLHARGLIAPYDGAADEQHLQGLFVATVSGHEQAAAWLTTPDPREAYLIAFKLLLCDWLELDASPLTGMTSRSSPA